MTGKLAGDWTYTFITDASNSQDTAAAGLQQAQITYVGFKGPDLLIFYPARGFTP